jgi:hypothetical protein
MIRNGHRRPAGLQPYNVAASQHGPFRSFAHPTPYFYVHPKPRPQRRASARPIRVGILSWFSRRGITFLPRAFFAPYTAHSGRAKRCHPRG